MSEAIGEPWRDKKEIASHFRLSVRSIERRMPLGLPHSHILGQARFKASEVESWLEDHGELQRSGR